MPDYFETWRSSRSEDEKRIALMGQRLRDPEVRRLSERLQNGILQAEPEPTLASSLYVREVRARTIGALLEAIEEIPDRRLRFVTVINCQWRIRARDLPAVHAETIKRQFRTHLGRAGVLDLPGFLVGFLEGEFEPNSRTYQLHYHLLTTARKAETILVNLRGRWGYEKTSTGACPIKRNQIDNRPAQLSYLLKSYWPQRPKYELEGRQRRPRDVQRIAEPYHTDVLLWLDKTRLSDLMILNDVVFRGGKFRLS